MEKTYCIIKCTCILTGSHVCQAEWGNVWGLALAYQLILEVWAESLVVE